MFSVVGGILIFVPGYEDIVNIRDKIITEDKQFTQSGGKYALFCLHSHMQVKYNIKMKL